MYCFTRALTALFIICSSQIFAQDMCESLCMCALSRATCVNIAVFPTVGDTNWVTNLTVISSSRLTFLPTLTHFQYINLRYLQFINCPNIDCDDIFRIANSKNNLRVFWDVEDCYSVHTTISSESMTSDTYTDETNDQFENQINFTSTNLPNHYQSESTSMTSSSTDTFQTMISVQNKNSGSSEIIPIISICVSISVASVITLFFLYMYCKYKVRQRNRVQRITLDNLNVTSYSNESAL